jgi:hypothetical protein
VIVIDEYLAVRVLGGSWPEGLPDEEDLGLPAGCHWRLLQRVHNSSPGRLSQLLASLPGGDLGVVRFPHPEVLLVMDPRPLLDHAARLAARYGGGLPRRSWSGRRPVGCGGGGPERDARRLDCPGGRPSGWLPA